MLKATQPIIRGLTQPLTAALSEFTDLGGVQQSISVNGVIYDLKIDDLTGQPITDDLTGQYIYAERSR